MKVFITLICMFACSISSACAQTKDITGIVTNEKNEGITGASVRVKNNTQSAFTDDNGTFALTGIPDTATLIISAKGYQELEVSVADKTTLTIVLVKAAGIASTEMRLKTVIELVPGSRHLIGER